MPARLTFDLLREQVAALGLTTTGATLFFINPLERGGQKL
jgi:hypothetical protein